MCFREHVKSVCTALMGPLLLLLLPGSAPAQDRGDVPRVTRTFAIEGARIVQAPGQVLERGTVVIRNGLIEAVGPRIQVPFDAERIPGDSLVVYAAFLDGLSHAGMPEEKEEEEAPRVEHPGSPPNDRAGIQPGRDALELLEPEAAALDTFRKIGFGAAHVVPRGGMLPGSGALVLLVGEDPYRMALQSEASLFAQFEGAERVYPSTPMGVMAKLRQLYREAKRRSEIAAMYAANAAGIERPPYDPAHQAFFAVIDGTKPLFFHTEGALEIHRALALQRELGFPLALAGLTQGFDVLDALKEAGDAPLFLSLELPEKPKTAEADTTHAADSLTVGTDTTKAITPEAPGSFFVRDLRTRSYEDVLEEQENLEARRQMTRAQHAAFAGRLHEAGLRFGFSTAGVAPEQIPANLREIIAHGLPEEAALAALTTDAAALLGLSESLGTVEPGKIANLVVTTGPLFDEASTVRFVFVDGEKFEYEEQDEKETGKD